MLTSLVTTYDALMSVVQVGSTVESYGRDRRWCSTRSGEAPVRAIRSYGR
jgi:hypothetical protein